MAKMYDDEIFPVAQEYIADIIFPHNIKILGCNGLTGNKKMLIVQCSLCARDQEMYGEGIFSISKSDIKAGRQLCACSKFFQHDNKQNLIRIERYLKEDTRGFSFVSLCDDFKKSTDKILLACPHEGHGIFDISLANLLQGRGCPQCRTDSVVTSRVITLDELLDRIKDHPVMSKYTICLDGDYVYCKCPICSKNKVVTHGGVSPIFKSSVSLLSSSRVPCWCSENPKYSSEYINAILKVVPKPPHVKIHIKNEITTMQDCVSVECENHGIFDRQIQRIISSCACPFCTKGTKLYAYINVVEDNGIPLALKFGITSKKDSRRVNNQNRKSCYTVRNVAWFKFTSHEDCVTAEKECKNINYNGVLSKSVLPDGYTETTYVFNIDEVVRIFKHHGGVRIDNL